MSNAAKSFDILEHSSSLSVLHIYFNSLTKLFIIAKFSDTLVKPFFPCCII